MGLAQSRVVVSRKLGQLNVRLDTRTHFWLDVAALVGVFFASSHLTWGTFHIWAVPDVFVPVTLMTLILPFVKFAILQTETDRLRRLAKLNGAVMLAYALYTAFVLMTRIYYSRSFLTYSFGMLMAWQTIDTFLFSTGVSPQLVAVPSPLVERLGRLSHLRVRVLDRPELARPFDGIVVDLHASLTPEWQAFIAECAASGAQVYHAATVYEAATGRVALDYLSERFLMDLAGARSFYPQIKRLIDIAVIGMASPLLLPLFLILAVLIKLDSPGPVLYFQERIGKGNVPFRMVKFRSMYVDSEADGAQFTMENDPRVTRIGKIMRRFRLDELPQLWNVLKGEMSLIGPRPEQTCFVRQFEKEIPFYSWRHMVKPGITGWAQVQQGYAAGVDDTHTKLEYDLYYIKNLSIWLDLSILVRTVGTVLTGSGAR